MILFHRARSVFIVLLLCAVSGPGRAQIRWADHPVPVAEDLAERVAFGYLTVPENREDSTSRTIEIAFTRIRNAADRDCADPVIFLPGGPGQGASAAVNRIGNWESSRAILETRDIVLLDPRGCGYSRPKLCTNLNDRTYYYNSIFLQGEAWEQNLAAAMRVCADSLTRAGVAIGSYRSGVVARDIEDLRRALGYTQWNLRGQSYGSYYGFVLMQEFPETVRSAFLSGIVSLKLPADHSQVNFLRALDGLLERCAEQRACRTRYPKLEQQLAEVLRRLDAAPIAVRVPDPAGEGELEYALTPPVLLIGLQNLLYRRAGSEIVPALIDGLHAGNDWIVQNLAELLLAPDAIDREMTTIIWSNDADPNRAVPGSPASDDRIPYGRLPREVSGRQLAWNLLRRDHEPPRDTFRAVAIPAVLMSGELDPVTPPENGELMQRYLPEATHLVVPHTGHFSYSHVEFAFADFLQDPKAGVSGVDLSPPPPMKFATDVDYNRGVSRVASAVARGAYGPLMLPALALLLAVIAFLLVTVSYLVGLVRRRTLADGRGRLLYWAVAVGTLLAAGLLVAAILDGLADNLFLVALGLPAGWNVLSVVFLFQLGLTLVGLYTLVRAWRSTPRLSGSIAVAGGLAFAAFAVFGGLL